MPSAATRTTCTTQPSLLAVEKDSCMYMQPYFAVIVSTNVVFRQHRCFWLETKSTSRKEMCWKCELFNSLLVWMHATGKRGFTSKHLFCENIQHPLTYVSTTGGLRGFHGLLSYSWSRSFQDLIHEDETVSHNRERPYSSTNITHPLPYEGRIHPCSHNWMGALGLTEKSQIPDMHRL
jgi:hypothetical protein